jgi:hypothetical protein
MWEASRFIGMERSSTSVRRQALKGRSASHAVFVNSLRSQKPKDKVCSLLSIPMLLAAIVFQVCSYAAEGD